MLAQCHEQLLVGLLAGERVEVDVGTVQLVVDVDARDRHELEPLVADAYQLFGDDLAERLAQARRTGVAARPAP
jgi:hypothetical protein